jgi:hypothetical protein
MRSKLLVILPALALALSACKKESVEGPLPGCMPAGVSTSRCAADSECCSFNCQYGACLPNPVAGGVCKTNGDCVSAPPPDGPGLLCMGNRCAAGTCNAGGACTPGIGEPCCTGTCSYSLGSYVCPADRAPVVSIGRDPSSAQVPWHVPVQLTNDSYDPDGGGLSYVWTSSPALAFEPDPTYPNPRVTPNALGTYTITLWASSNGQTRSASLSFEAINTPPVATVDPYMAATSWSRNVPFQFSVPVSDDDGGPVTCEWWKLSPAAGADPVLVSSTMCAAQTGGAARGSTTVTLNEDLEGIWTMRLITSDGTTTNAWNRFITVVNDRPTIDAMPDRVGNFGAPGLPAPAIPLHATARDVNGDVAQTYFTYSWKLTATKPAGEERPAETEIGTGPDAQFVPSAVGPYVIRVDVDDQHTNGTQSATVNVLVEPYILPLGVVVDAVHDKGSDKIVAIGTAVGGGYRLWVIDPAVPRIMYDVALASAPTCVALSPDGSEALVGESGGYQKVTNILTGLAAQAKLGFYMGTTRQSGAVASDIVHVGNNRGFAVDTGANVYILDLAATADPSGGTASCPTCNLTPADNLPSGRRAVANATHLWLLNTGRLSRYEIHSNGNLINPAISRPAVSGTTGLWLGAGAAQVFTATGDVFDATTLASTARLSSARDHLDTTITTGLKGVTASSGSTALLRFDETFADTGTLQLPQLGKAGTGYANKGRFAFVKIDETGFYAIVTADTGTSVEWGLVKLP